MLGFSEVEKKSGEEYGPARTHGSQMPGNRATANKIRSRSTGMKHERKSIVKNKLDRVALLVADPTLANSTTLLIHTR